MVEERQADRAYASIVELINVDRLEIGDRLPSEARLAEMVGVSRTIIREARPVALLTAAMEKQSVKLPDGKTLADVVPEPIRMVLVAPARMEALPIIQNRARLTVSPMLWA